MAKPVELRLEGPGTTNPGPYAMELLDLGLGGLRCIGAMPLVEPGTRVLVTLKVPLWIAARRLQLPATILRLVECPERGLRTAEIGLQFPPAEVTAQWQRGLRSYLHRARRAYENLVATQGLPSQLAESFRMLRVSIGAWPTEGPRRILITSSVPGEGKSFIAGNLALHFAREGHRVLLVDTDLRRPTLHETFGVASPRGLAQWLTNGSRANLDQYAQPTSAGVDLIAAGIADHQFSEIWAHTSAGLLSEALGKINYPFVVLDSPPVLLSASTVRLASEVDDVVLVVRAGLSRERDVSQAKSLLERGGAKLRGIVLNDDSESASRYGSGYYGDSGRLGKKVLRLTKDAEADEDELSSAVKLVAGS
jgi:capsular exopolysaccharide synthesis family protein